MISRNNDKTIKEAIDHLLDSYRLRKKFDETSLIAAWPELMGTAIANRTKQLYISDKKLFLRIESAVIKKELMMMQTIIIKRLNDKAGHEVIQSLVFL